MTRHFWVLVHRYAGLYMAFFLLVAGLTGSILAFTEELNGWLNPPEKITLQPGPRLDEFALRERAEALQPHGLVNVLNFKRKPDEAYTAYFEPQTDPATGKPYPLPFTQLSLNPYTGAEISRDKPSDDIWPITRKNLLVLIIRLHYQLALPGMIGTWLFGIAALVWTIDCFVSVYLTFPLTVRRHRQGDGKPQKSWWARWQPSWLVKWQGSAFRINFDLHRAGGLWVWLMLLVLAWSSVGFNLGEQIYQPVMKAIFNMHNPYTALPELETPKPKPALSWQDAYRTAQDQMAEQARINGFNVLHEEALQYDAGKGVFFYIVHSDRDLRDEFGGTWLVLDGATNKFGGLYLPTGQNAGTTLSSWIFALHMAMIWGLPYKLFECFVGIVIAMLSITGVYIWLKKHKARQWSRQHKKTRLVNQSATEDLRFTDLENS
ncbi:MAG: PepSY-associated TM helix domain-containing protein [Methylovulum sp.]|nr:PepSY-associated TM helix domain-containing protein [Methylovulum sp.]